MDFDQEVVFLWRWVRHLLQLEDFRRTKLRDDQSAHDFPFPRQSTPTPCARKAWKRRHLLGERQIFLSATASAPRDRLALAPGCRDAAGWGEDLRARAK
ncbi:MAG: hypothetical protein DME25_01535 [Verrucomicrobia bacterium]|nr:MAG: hypothetical protein DME25_01535 [Verrucomicrobiota bacterium]